MLQGYFTPGHEDFGRNKTYYAKYKYYDMAERVALARTENEMIKDRARLIEQKRKAQEQAMQNNNEQRRRETWMPIIDVLVGPMTSPEIAERLGREVSPVANSLRAMEKHGLVTRTEQGRDALGRQLPFIWEKVGGKSCYIANRQKGEKTRQQALAAMDGPTTANEIAAKVGHSAHHCQQVLRELERQGRVKRAGKGPKLHGKGSAPTLWVKA